MYVCHLYLYVLYVICILLYDVARYMSHTIEFVCVCICLYCMYVYVFFSPGTGGPAVPGPERPGGRRGGDDATTAAADGDGDGRAAGPGGAECGGGDAGGGDSEERVGPSPPIPQGPKTFESGPALAPRARTQMQGGLGGARVSCGPGPGPTPGCGPSRSESGWSERCALIPVTVTVPVPVTVTVTVPAVTGGLSR